MHNRNAETLVDVDIYSINDTNWKKYLTVDDFNRFLKGYHRQDYFSDISLKLLEIIFHHIRDDWITEASNHIEIDKKELRKKLNKLEEEIIEYVSKFYNFKIYNIAIKLNIL